MILPDALGIGLDDRLPAQTRTRTRIAIVSTPRSGNTWLRHLLMKLYGVPGIVASQPADIDWASLTDQDCVLQIHWHPLPSLLDRLREFHFQVIALARHPLDILISVLHFALHQPTTQWLNGEAGNEHSILGAMPRSAAFLDYAVSPRATALLSVSREWWLAPESIRVRYEDLVADPTTTLTCLIDDLGGVVQAPLHEALAATSLDRLRETTLVDQHFWQGKPGLWRSLLTAAEAKEIASAHPAVFADLDYECDADLSLSERQADANWVRLTWATVADDLHNLQVTQRTAKHLESRLAQSKRDLQAARDRIGELEPQLLELHDRLRELESSRARWSQFEVLGPYSLNVAMKFHHLSLRHPTLSLFLRGFLRLFGLLSPRTGH